jgi:hypothetical protein
MVTHGGGTLDLPWPVQLQRGAIIITCSARLIVGANSHVEYSIDGAE